MMAPSGPSPHVAMERCRRSPCNRDHDQGREGHVERVHMRGTVARASVPVRPELVSRDHWRWMQRFAPQPGFSHSDGCTSHTRFL